MNDVRDILDLRGADDAGQTAGTSGSAGRKILSRRQAEAVKRPEGMHRELFALLCADGGLNMDLAPLLPTDTPGGYKQKVNLGAKKVRKWKWIQFTNPGRKDGAVFHHWRREGDEAREYPFAKFNREVPVLKYSEQEYAHNLEKEGWTKEETDHLFDMARRFDLRFPVIQARYEKGIDGASYPQRTIEDLKERYYQVTGILTKLRAEPGQPEPKVYSFDSDHERRRKEQLNKLWSRTQFQVEEEDFLRAELKKIEARKKEREKKTQDLQKLITAADGGGLAQAPDPVSTKKATTDSTKKSHSSSKKKSSSSAKTLLLPNQEISFFGIKWSDYKNPGVTMRSQRMKLPGSVGQKKAKAVEAKLIDLQVDAHPLQDHDVAVQFNELRSDCVLHYELRSLLTTCEMEIQSLKHQYETANPGETLEIPKELEAINIPPLPVLPETKVEVVVAPPPPEPVAEVEVTPNRKRKAALEQGNILKKLKNKM